MSGFSCKPWMGVQQGEPLGPAVHALSLFFEHFAICTQRLLSQRFTTTSA